MAYAARSLIIAGALLLSCARPPAPRAPQASARSSPSAAPEPAPAPAASGAPATAPATAGPDTPPAASCIDRRNAAYRQAVAAVAAAEKACADDADCVVVPITHNCGGACPVGLRAGAEGAVRQAIVQIDRRCEGFREACPSHFVRARCANVVPRCQTGQCVAREPAELGPYCCTGACRRDGKVSVCSECRLLIADHRGKCDGTIVNCQARADFALGELRCDGP